MPGRASILSRSGTGTITPADILAECKFHCILRTSQLGRVRWLQVSVQYNRLAQCVRNLMPSVFRKHHRNPTGQRHSLALNSTSAILKPS